MHDGGVQIRVTLNGKEVCNSIVKYGGHGHELVQPDGEIWKTMGKTSGCINALRVHKGDKFQFEATFDFNAHPP
jgi:hypothetical protein